MKFVLFLLILLTLPIVYSAQIPLLAVKESDNGFIGSSAQLQLEIKEGKGRVFLDTYPLTKLDTQMSTRFAKEMACKDKNCDKYDFIYTIKSNSVIVGGPSAGATITLLTITELEKLDIKKGMAITGTINSGGLIGTVGGLKEKIDAAKELNLNTVLIPHGEKISEINNITIADYVINISQDNVSTINLIKYGKSLGIEVIEVSTIDEALYYATGKEIKKLNTTLIKDKTYTDTMKKVTAELCTETLKSKKLLSNFKDKIEFQEALNLTERYELAFKNEKYYSAASYCFGANTKFTYLQLMNITEKQITIRLNNIKSSIRDMNKIIDNKKLKTITDLETYMIIKERLVEAETTVDNILKQENKTKEIKNLAYSIERINSAVSWANFFDKGTKEFIINKEEIKNSCINKISEAEERHQYLNLLINLEFKDTEEELELAKKDLEDGNYELCLFKASKAKANSDVILNTIGIEESQLLDVHNRRLEILRENIIKEQQKGIFPIIGYSYYEYSEDLKEKDIYSSMLFAEYSLELSNLDIYFKEEIKEQLVKINIEKNILIGFILIFISGLLIGFGLSDLKKKIKKSSKKGL
jgi:uncharacterized protein